MNTDFQVSFLLKRSYKHEKTFIRRKIRFDHNGKIMLSQTYYIYFAGIESSSTSF
jgi:hypothetical protein